MTNPEFIAEISCNHCGSEEILYKLIRQCKDNGADSIKIQYATPDDLVDMSRNDVIKSGAWKGRSLQDLYAESFRFITAYQDIADYTNSICKEIGIPWFASVFNPKKVEYLYEMGCRRFKIASPEANYTELLKRVGETKCPVLVSLGCTEITEQNLYKIHEAVGHDDLTFMHCVSQYPAKPEEMNLGCIKTIRDFGYKVGLSDHSGNCYVSGIAHAAYGIDCVEAHVGHWHNGSLDESFSILPGEIYSYKCKMRTVPKMLGNVHTPNTMWKRNETTWLRQITE